MSKILILAETGFGKSSAIGPISKEDFERAGIPDSEIIGLNPKETMIIAASNKGLPIPRWKTMYFPYVVKLGPDSKPVSSMGNYFVTNDGDMVRNVIWQVNTQRPDIKNIVFDDSNYVMQDYYMSKALTGGYDVFKKIGAFMGGIFNEMENVSGTRKNFIMMAHFEEYKNSNTDTISYRYKTVGKMVQDYITPEGKFEIVLFGKQSIVTEGGRKTIRKEFVTNYDGQYPAKSPIGMFPKMYIPNDLGYVLKCIESHGS